MDQKQGQLRLVASGDGRDNSIKIHQDVALYVAVLKKGDRLNHPINSNRSLWLQIAKGSVEINGQTINNGDGVDINQRSQIALIVNSNETEILLFNYQSSLKLIKRIFPHEYFRGNLSTSFS